MRRRHLLFLALAAVGPLAGVVPIDDAVPLLRPGTAEAALLPSAPSDPADWLSWVNWYRSLGDIPPLTNDPGLDVGPRNHTRYLAAAAAAGVGSCTHGQVPGRPWPTGEDHRHNIVACGTSSMAGAVSLWMQTPYHGAPILDPTVGTAGAGISGSYQAMRFAKGPSIARVYTWPKDRGVIPSLTFPGNESPDPYVACPDAARPAGQPLFAFFPTARIYRSVSLTTGGQELGVCALGAAAGQSATSVIVFPKKALTGGTTYTATVVTDQGTITWTASTVGPATGRVIAPTPPPVVTVGLPATLTPIGPTRVGDSRAGVGLTRFTPYVPQRLPIAGAFGIPQSAKAVVVNVAAVGPDGDGFITAYPCDGPIPPTSTVNYRQRQILPTLTTVGLSDDGAMCLVSHAATDVVVDLFGTMSPGTGEGLHVMTPTRVLDTRAPLRRMRANEVVEVTVAGTAGVPANATAFSANVTAVNPSADGYLTVWPCGQARPATANLNIERGGIRPNLVTAALGAGKWCLSSITDVDVVIDGLGWWGASGRAFSAVRPVRLADTRLSDVELGRSATLVIALAGRSGLPTDLSAVALTVTATQAQGAGYVQVVPCGSQTITSTVNVEAGGTVSNTAMVGIGADGAVCLTVSATMHVVVDLTGYWS